MSVWLSTFAQQKTLIGGYICEWSCLCCVTVRLRLRWWWSCWGVTQKTMPHRLASMPTGEEHRFFPPQCSLTYELHSHKCKSSSSSLSLYNTLFRCIVRALKDPNTFLFDHLMALKPVRFLEGELIHDVRTTNMAELLLIHYSRYSTT